ncbi:MAG TPA: hypothetical protein VN030_07925 [Cellvibrio sp.]|nr:hypothetical protein [Cellvibrio sp.]
MINSRPQKIMSIAALALSAIFLQACGGQREAPFDPDGTNNSSSRGSEIEVKELTTGTSPVGSVVESSKLIVISDEGTYQNYWASYTGTGTPKTVDWVNYQVLLADLGETTSCDIKSRISNINAYKYSDTKVQVIIDYGTSTAETSSSNSSNSSSSTSNASSSSSSAASSCGNANLIQRYYFFTIKTRSELFIEDKVK